MITLLSPAKTLDYVTPPNITYHTLPRFLEESESLVKQLKKLSPQNISELMDVSDKIANLNLVRFSEWNREEIKNFNPLVLDAFTKTKQAILAFNGDVYDGLEANSFSLPNLYHCQHHIRILSGLYGLLRPLDVIQAYRLEMGTTLKIGKNPDLYSFWGDKITNRLISDLEVSLEDTNSPKSVVNCASMEYFKSINTKLLKKANIPLVTPLFMNRDNQGELKVVAIHAKKARGEFARFTIEEKIKNVEDLTAFSDWNQSHYHYDLDLSKKMTEETGDNKMVFRRSREIPDEI
jgi:cytoplasmic iron level regulating protein YaaA (DUF328/UPF0246 family)